jgi:hypothetical protein
VRVRELTDRDLPAAQRILCSAFGTFLGAPDPSTFWADRDLRFWPFRRGARRRLRRRARRLPHRYPGRDDAPAERLGLSRPGLSVLDDWR